MRQKNGRYICVQILQTLNILFENIRDENLLCKNITKEKNKRFLIHENSFYYI